MGGDIQLAPDGTAIKVVEVQKIVKVED